MGDAERIATRRYHSTLRLFDGLAGACLLVSPLCIAALLLLQDRRPAPGSIVGETLPRVQRVPARPRGGSRPRRTSGVLRVRPLSSGTLPPSRPERATLIGRVVDPDGYRLPSTLVELKSRAADSVERTVSTTATTADGSYRFMEVSPGRTVWIEVVAPPSYFGYRGAEFEVPRGAFRIATIVLDPLGVIRGRVSDRRGFPIPGARTSLNSWDRRADHRPPDD